MSSDQKGKLTDGGLSSFAICCISKVRYYVLGKAPGIDLAAPHSAPSARLPRGRPFVRHHYV
jgi:hypothetical protein